jgi:hypothetical protein
LSVVTANHPTDNLKFSAMGQTAVFRITGQAREIRGRNILGRSSNVIRQDALFNSNEQFTNILLGSEPSM